MLRSASPTRRIRFYHSRSSSAQGDILIPEPMSQAGHILYLQLVKGVASFRFDRLPWPSMRQTTGHLLNLEIRRTPTCLQIAKPSRPVGKINADAGRRMNTAQFRARTRSVRNPCKIETLCIGYLGEVLPGLYFISSHRGQGLSRKVYDVWAS